MLSCCLAADVSRALRGTNALSQNILKQVSVDNLSRRGWVMADHCRLCAFSRRALECDQQADGCMYEAMYNIHSQAVPSAFEPVNASGEWAC